MSFSLGTPSSAPATGLSTGFSFGANKPATPGFGVTATSQPSTGLFGSTPATSAPAFGNISFSSTTTTPAFGTTSTGFGSTTTPAFGALSTAPAFGATTSAPKFGASAAPTFGTTTTPAFGATNVPTLGTGLNFGAGSNATATGATFGTNTSTTASTGLGGLGGFGASTSAQSTGLGVFGSTTTSTTSNSFFGAKLGTTNVTNSLPSTSTTPSLGLGGVSSAAGATGTATTAADGKSESPKQTKLPNEILNTVNIFKDFVKKQKSLSSDVMRVSVKPLYKVSQDAEATLRLALSLSGEVSKVRAQSRRLRSTAASALAAAENAARDPPGCELEGSAPPAYIKELVSELEQQLITFRRQMDVADKQIQATPKLLSEQELTLGIRRMHESLVALAGRLQTVHAQVEAQKEQYLLLRKHILKVSNDVFETPSSSSLDQILREEESRKKSKSSNLHDISHGSVVLQDPKEALGSVKQLAGPTPFSYFSNTISTFPTTDAKVSQWQTPPQPQVSNPFTSNFGSATNEQIGFQLQKAPGKRTKQ